RGQRPAGGVRHAGRGYRQGRKHGASSGAATVVVSSAYGAPRRPATKGLSCLKSMRKPCYHYKPAPAAKGYVHQYVVYKPGHDRKWVYWYNPEKKVYWARCPTVRHPTYGK